MINKREIKAVGMISGGLDSTLAAKVIKDLGIDVYGVYFSMPWGCCDKTKAIEAAQSLNIKFIVLQLDERYLNIVKNPKHGYGRALNPCVDCRIHMFSRAAQYMQHISADFVFTGEVLGQRNMSQLTKSLKWVEEGSGLKGKLLRPLCAQLLEPTQIEKDGIVDRSKLLKISGRSRKEQYTLAKKLEVTEFSEPAGGCLLTNSSFAIRMQDTLDHGYRNFRETIALKWGKHFRINKDFKAILGRDKEENENLLRFAHSEDHIMQLEDNKGPTLILKGDHPTEEVLKICASLIKQLSKYKASDCPDVLYWKNNRKHQQSSIKPQTIDQKLFESMYLI